MSIFVLNKPSNVETATKVKDQGQEVNTPDKEIIENIGEKASDGKTIVIEGPLSHVYTQALNIAFAKEGLSTVLKTSEHDMDDIEGDKDVYMYCCDTDSLEKSGLTETVDKLRIALDSKKGKKIIVAVEHSGNVTSKMGLLGEFAKSIGVEMISTYRGESGKVIKSLI